MARAKRQRSTYVLPEPNWKEIALLENEEERTKAYRDADYFMRYEIADKAIRTAYKTWLRKKSGYTEDEIKKILTLSDWNFNHIGKFAFFEAKVGWMPQECLDYVNGKKDELLKKAESKSDFDVDEEEDNKPKPKVVKIRENLPNALNFVDLAIDDIISGKTAPKVDAMKDFALNKAEVDQIIVELGKYKDEYEELQRVRTLKKRSDWDEQLVEGFSNLKVVVVKRILEFYNSVEAHLMNELQTKKIVRIRKKKPTDKNKIVRRLRYLSKYDELGIKSFNPVDIIGATEVWYYDVKRKRLGVYASDFPGGLGVKGTSIENFGSKSYEKTVRKPEDVVKEFMKARANGLHRFMESIRGRKFDVRSRLQPNSVLLRVKA